MAPISYSTGSTGVNAEASTVTVPAPPAYEAGNLLVMGVIGATQAGTAVAAETPSGWTAVTGSGAILAIFTKTATGSEPSSYTVTMSSSCCAAAWVAAYPAATVASSSFANSGANVVTWSPTPPSGVSGTQLVLVPAGAIPGTGAVKAPVGNQNLNFPSGVTAEIPVFAPTQPSASGGPYTAATGLADVPGSGLPGSPQFTSAQQCTFYAGFIVLTVTGTASPLTVTATAAYPAGYPGLAVTVKALTGAATALAIAAGGAAAPWYADGTSQAPQAQLTPKGTGSWIYGAVTENSGVTGSPSFTANGASTFSQNVADSVNSCIYGTFRSTATTAAGSPVTLGGSAPDNAYTTAALAEILAAPGATLSEAATATAAGTIPGNFTTASVAQSAIFPSAPAPGSLLVAMVSANSLYGNGDAAVTVTDSSGLDWIPLAQAAYPSYSGVWAASVPPAAGESAAVLMAFPF